MVLFENFKSSNSKIVVLVAYGFRTSIGGFWESYKIVKGRAMYANILLIFRKKKLVWTTHWETSWWCRGVVAFERENYGS